VALVAACGGCLLTVYLAPRSLRAGVACASVAVAVVLCAAVTTAAHQALTCRRLRAQLGALTVSSQAPAVPGPVGAAPRVPRQRPVCDVDLASLVVSTGEPAPGTPGPQQAVLRACRAPVAVAEVAARLRMPVGRVRALVGELLADGRVAVRPPAAATGGGRPGVDLLVRVQDALRAL
jgi:hypothetical protein